MRKIPVLMACLLAANLGPLTGLQAQTNQWAGSRSCRECHAEFYQKWATSHHGLAMQVFTMDFARNRLTPMTNVVVVGEYRYQADIGKSPAVVRETGPAGGKELRIEHVLGGKNVCYFLTSLERGRLQTLPVAYDMRRKEWFDTSASALRHIPGLQDALVHWTEAPYTFNTSCHGCHVSQLSRNYDPATDTYRTTWAEPGINCETCHGPATEHVRVCVAAKGGPAPADLKIVSTRSMTPAQRNDQCSSCHAKATVLSDAFPPGARFTDHFGLVTLESPDYHPDGRDLGENYTYTSWRMSACLKSETFECLHCHTSSGRFRFADNPNAACLPCHQQRVESVASHSHHPAGSSGNQCIACHMPRTEFARMVRSDHSMLPPTPAATLALNSPNACNLCHTNKDAGWADKWVREWHPDDDYRNGVLRRASLVEAARKRDWSRLAEMLQYIGNPTRDEVSAASLIRLLGACTDAAKWPALRRTAADSSPLIRAAAVSELEADLRDQVSLQIAAKALGDDSRQVRLAAAVSLMGYPREHLSPPQAEVLGRVLQEYLKMLLSRPDSSMNQYNLANYYQIQGDAKAALQAYETSSRLDPGNILPLVNVSMLHAQAGQLDKAEQALRRALKQDPASAPANFNLGLLLAERGNLKEAESCLRVALKSDPTMAAAAYNLAVMLAESRPEEAIALCRQAMQHRPDEPKYSFTLAFYQNRRGESAAAAATLEKGIERNPGHLDSVMLLGEIHERAGRRREAAALYQKTLDRAALPTDLQAVLRARIAALQMQFPR